MHNPAVDSYRSVAQPGRALRSGRRGRWFEPSHSDQKKYNTALCGVIFFRVSGWARTSEAVRLRSWRESEGYEPYERKGARALAAGIYNPVTPTIRLHFVSPRFIAGERIREADVSAE